MTKRDFIIKQLAKTNKKNFEHYVVTRFFHLLNRTDVKFVCQQLVNRSVGYALTDMFFPQLELHIEVDEPFHEKQKQWDIDRELEIIQATAHELKRVKITENIEEINTQIDEILNYIKAKIIEKEQNKSWEKWDIDNEFDPTIYIKKEYLDVKDYPKFRTMVDASNILGQNYDGQQRSFIPSKVYEGHYLWYPKFYENDEWDNQISKDGTVITEKCKNKDKYEGWFDKVSNNPVKRIAFPRRIDNLGFKFYRFEGVFETDFRESSFEKGVIHRLIQKRISIKIHKT